MKTFAATVLVFTALGWVSPSFAAEADCRALWEKVDANKDGVVDATEGAALMEAIKASGKTYDKDADGKLAAAEFSAACADNAFKDVKM